MRLFAMNLEIQKDFVSRPICILLLEGSCTELANHASKVLVKAKHGCLPKDKRSNKTQLRSSARWILAPLGRVLHREDVHRERLLAGRLQPDVVPPVDRVVDVHLIAHRVAEDVLKLRVQNEAGAEQHDAAHKAHYRAQARDETPAHLEAVVHSAEAKRLSKVNASVFV